MLPSLVGGHFFRHPMQKRIYGLAAWSPHPFPLTSALRLPASVLPGRVPPRIAQIVKFQGITFANVHLSHGQFLNRFQLHHIAYAVEGPAVIMGDFNAVGPIISAGISRRRPAQAYPRASNIVSLRLDRCITRACAIASPPRCWTRGRPTITPSCWNSRLRPGLRAIRVALCTRPESEQKREIVAKPRHFDLICE